MADITSTDVLPSLQEIFLRFSPWTHWANRKNVSIRSPGVYMLATFKDEEIPQGKPALSADIIYIGETCDQTLHKRLYQFNRSAFDRKFAHSGGKKFASLYNNVPQIPLFVAVMDIDPEEAHASAYIRFAERALLLAYVQKYKCYPKCNSK